MKRILLIITCLVIFAIDCDAQRGSKSFGFKAGPNVDWVNTASSAGRNNGTRFGFTTGFFVDNYFTDHVAFSIGLNYSRLRMKYQFTDYRRMVDFLEYADVQVNREFKGSYVEMPLKIKVRMEVYDSWAVFAEGGVGVGVNFADRAKDSYNFYGIKHFDEGYSDVTNQYRMIQTSLDFGLGAQYEVSSSLTVFAQLTYNHALSNTFTKWMQDTTGSNLKTNYIGLEFGILL